MAPKAVEYLCLALVGGLDGRTALYDGINLKLHTRHVRRGLQFRTCIQRTIELIADQVGIAVLVGETNRCLRNRQRFAITGNGHLRHSLWLR